MANKWIEVRSTEGKPITSGDLTLTPVAQAVRIGPPRLPVGLIWNRPQAVLLETSDGDRRTIPVPDVTRQMQVAALLAVVVWLIVWLVGRR